MKRTKKIAISFLVYALVLVQVLCVGGVAASAKTGTKTFEDSFDYADYDAMASGGVWTPETLYMAGTTTPTVSGGVLKLDPTNAVAFKWINVIGIDDYVSTRSYTFDFDVKITNFGNGSTMGYGDATRALFIGMGGYYNQVELVTAKTQFRAGDTWVDITEDACVNKTFHVSLVLLGDKITSTIKDAAGNVVATGERTNAA